MFLARYIFDKMLKYLCFHALVKYFVIVSVTCAGINFTSTPGLMRYKDNDDVTFTWMLDRKPERFIEISVSYNGVTIVKQIADGTVTTNIKYKGRVSLMVTDKTIEMTLANVNKDDVIYGVYKIIASIVISGSVTTVSDNSAQLYLFGKPTKPVISGVKDIKEGKDITLSCMASPNSVPTKYQLPMRYTWTRDDINLTKNLPTRHTVNDYQLIITDVRRDDRNRHYTCIAGEDGGLSSESNDVLLRVLYPPGKATAAVVQIGPLIEGENANTAITCSVSDPGYPQAIFKWSKDNQDQSGGEHGTISIRQGSAAVSKHDGTWKCTPSNSVGDGPSAVISVIVNAKASLSPTLPSMLTVIADSQDSFSVTCGFISKPAAIISWTYNNGQLPTSVITQPMTTTASGKKSIVIQKLLWNPDSDTTSRRSAGGQYLCKGIVDLGPGQLDSKQSQLILNVEWRYDFCETPTQEEGIALYNNITISVCLTANPFTQITKDNWTFQPSKQQKVRNLPDDVSISVEDRRHVYKKFVKLHINKISESHYGTYTLKLRNRHSIHEMEYTFNLLPEGPPVPPEDIKITYITAVSIYLEWMAGFDGGPDQTFWLYVFDIETSDWFIISNIPDTSKGHGGLIEYKLTQEQGFLPDHKYNIHVGAINSISNVTGPSVLVHTKPLPIFKSNTPEIIYKNNTAEITWSINNLESVTNIMIQVCVSDGSSCNPPVNITSPEKQPYLIPLAEGAIHNCIFIFTFYDGADIVNIITTKEMIKEHPSVSVILGGTLAVFVVAAVGISLIILWRKGIIPKVSTTILKRKQENTEVDSYETLGMRSTEQSQVSSVYEQMAEPTLIVYNTADIMLQSVIKTGEFYDIWNGKLKSKDNVTLDVVIKSSKVSKVIYVHYLKEQGATMCKLRSDYTVACFGISRDNKYLLMENASLGNLQKYLREQSDNAYYNVGNDQNLSKLMNFIHQIIKGVKSVFHLQPPALFYCLSASNVLITNQQQCKLTGFATSTAVTEREKWEEEHNQPRSIRWLSPEAINLNHIRESDIWSFGVLLWEITSHGKQPLADVNDEEIKNLIVRGHRLLKPMNCTGELYDIMCSCWQYQPNSRPSVDDLESRLLELTQYEVV